MGGGGGDSIGAALEEGGRAAPGGGMRGGAAIVWEGGRRENRRRRKKIEYIEINELNSDIYPGTQVYCLTITGSPVLNSELLSFLFSKV
jgi:hypothetical protein